MDAPMDLLYNAAVIASTIRATYHKIKSHPTARYFVYVLLLQDGKFYVGSTDNPYMRFVDHFMCSNNSAAWVREWGPPIRVVEMIKNASGEDEHYKYAEYAEKFGWDNVRGGGCCRMFMHREPPSVTTFTRKAEAFEYMSRTEIDDIVSKVNCLVAQQQAT